MTDRKTHKCVRCDRPVQKDAAMVEVAISGELIRDGDPRSGGPESQGGFLIGPECLRMVKATGWVRGQ